MWNSRLIKFCSIYVSSSYLWHSYASYGSSFIIWVDLKPKICYTSRLQHSSPYWLSSVPNPIVYKKIIEILRGITHVPQWSFSNSFKHNKNPRSIFNNLDRNCLMIKGNYSQCSSNKKFKVSRVVSLNSCQTIKDNSSYTFPNIS